MDEKVKSEVVAIWQSGGILSKDLLVLAAGRQNLRYSLLASHPFFKTKVAIDQVASAFNILSRARNEIIDLSGKYHASVRYDSFKSTEETRAAVTAQVFQFSFAAFSLIAMYRRLISAAPKIEKSYQSLVTSVFADRGLMSFIQELRNCYGHQWIFVVRPTGKITHAEEITAISDIEFDSADLLSHSGWNADAKKYIQSHMTLNVLGVVDEYFRCSARIHERYMNDTGLADDHGLMEFARFEETSEMIPKLMCLNLMVKQGKQAGANPYNFLHNYFSVKEIRRINCLPRNSREQVSYMLSVADPLKLCSAELTEEIYSFFAAAERAEE